ncbi:ATP-binding protein [Streptomyces sp. UNOC14_S4]|uniref:ATP-binding protein n=1 Tax=Streptomyces sp. UNOC14_S4 TaxID=2872340 RepID=UPI001E65503F|nr:ATP-binding protein [Streptomyces sp. UNOC14_S4]MCC3771069.1 ATP-binding protein [Streptomyces sp. UNOC14_S4]
MSVSLCPLIHQPVPATERPPLPLGKIAYCFTLPGGPEAAGIACDNARASLSRHSISDITLPALQVVSELTAAASLFAPGQALYVHLRWREEDDSLRTIVWDPHPRTHADPDSTATCIAHRKRQLLRLARIVHECGGNWGLSEPADTSEGTRVWADLPRTGAAAYARQPL